MEESDFKFNLVDNYLGLLRSLSPENKMELISRLSDSLKGSTKPTVKSISDLYGAFISNESVDEILSHLRTNRNLSRQWMVPHIEIVTALTIILFAYPIFVYATKRQVLTKSEFFEDNKGL